MPEQIDLSPNQDGGVLKRIVREGAGDARAGLGDTVEVHYTGRLTNGEVFDSSESRGEPFAFVLGKGEVIRGWDLTVATMRLGELCEVTLTSEYGYGAGGSPPKIGPNETLVFEIELLGWQNEDVTPDQSKQVQKQVLRAGDGHDRPRQGSVVINLSGRVELPSAAAFDQRERLSFQLGEGGDLSVPSGVELALHKMKKGELARVFVRGTEFGFDAHVAPPAGAELPEQYSQLVYDVELLSFENEKETWELNTQERLDQAELTKNKGTEQFKRGRYALALRQYQKIVQYLGPPDNQDFGDQASVRDRQLLSGYLNLAICYLKLDQPEEVLKNTNLALELDANNPKALFRRGLANFAIKEYETAILDFNRCLEIEPDNKAAKNQIVICRHQLKQHSDMEKKIYRNLLEVLSKDDN